MKIKPSQESKLFSLIGRSVERYRMNNEQVVIVHNYFEREFRQVCDNNCLRLGDSVVVTINSPVGYHGIKVTTDLEFTDQAKEMLENSSFFTMDFLK